MLKKTLVLDIIEIKTIEIDITDMTGDEVMMQADYLTTIPDKHDSYELFIKIESQANRPKNEYKRNQTVGKKVKR